MTAREADVQTKGEDELEAGTEVLDSRGDLTLVVGEPKAAFLVCSRSLARVSPFWEAMLYGPFAEGSDQHDPGEEGDWVVDLPEDDPSPLRIVLWVVHGRFGAVPLELAQDDLFNLALLCDKYDMVGILRPFWHGWVTALPRQLHRPSSVVHRLWIARVLGYLTYYKATLQELMVVVGKRGSRDGLYLDQYKEINLYDDAHLRSLGVLEPIEAARLVLLNAAAGRLKESIDRLTDGTALNHRKRVAWNSASQDQHCDDAMLGAVHRILRQKTWYYSGAKGWQERSLMSVRHLIAKLEEVRVEVVNRSHDYHDSDWEEDHERCTPWTPFKIFDLRKAREVEGLVPVDVERFARQQALSGVLDPPKLGDPRAVPAFFSPWGFLP